MRWKIFLLIPLLAACCFALIHSTKNATSFIPFDEAQIQDDYSPKELIHFYQRLKKKKWKTMQTLYSQNLSGKLKRRKKSQIPKILHQIWLGSPLPEKLASFQRSWISHHPDWDYHLWTDKEVEILYLKNRPLYEATSHNEHKSQILRYEILSQFGGVYVDIESECLHPLDILVENCQFFAGMSGHIHSPEILDGIIGSVPNHPVLRSCIRSLPNQAFHQIESGPAFLTRVFFDEWEKKKLKKTVILPATFFYPIPLHKKSDQDLQKWVKANTFSIHH